MGYGDGFFKETPSNILLDNSSPLFDNIVDSKVDLYVSTAGDDTNGDGSESNPYATPQRAVDSIPDIVSNGLRIQIFCGTGEFDCPNLSFVPSNIRLSIIGSMEGEIINIPAGSISFSTVSGKRASVTGNVGSYSATISEDSHFIAAVGFGSTIAYCAVTSTSPNLNGVFSSFTPDYFDIKVCEYRTIFNFSNSTRIAFGTSQSGIDGGYVASFFGISFVMENSSLSFQGFAFSGCKFVKKSGSSSANVTFKSCNLGSYVSSEIGCVLIGGSLNYAIVRRASYPLSIKGGLETILCYGSILAPIDLDECSNLNMYDIDFESSFGNYAINIYKGGTFVSVSSCSVSGTVGFINSSSSINASIETYGSVTGTVTGNIITLANGGQAKGIKAACNGKITTSGGSEIVIGGNTAGQTFASLPATDLAAASPQFCRAT